MNLYQEEILEHYRNPRNKKRIENPTASFDAINPLCGDKLSVDVLVKDGLICDIGFWGEGCAISQASMSMLTEELIGNSLKEVSKIQENDILSLLGVPIGPNRMKCALLSMRVIEKLKGLYEESEKS
jgi:nitrogen fixation protein NifU and related proteins